MELLAQRMERLDWDAHCDSLQRYGFAKLPAILLQNECGEFIKCFEDDSLFRSHIVMSRFRFGEGEYKYFKYPLPAIIQTIRQSTYPYLAVLANSWNQALGVEEQFPNQHKDFIQYCNEKGQHRPTPLLLHYEKGDYNCMHQDIYGSVAFPLQMAIFLSQKGEDYEGGQFVLTEQQPRAQSRAYVIESNRGEAVVFTTRYRPVQGKRGYYRVNMRHGVSMLTRGRRYTLGIIYHDAE